MSISLHTDSRFPCPQRLELVLRHLDVPIKEIHQHDILKSTQKTESLLESNPAGSVPFIQDTAVSPPLTLSESRAIARYVTKMYGHDSGLLPRDDDVVGWAKFEQAASMEVAAFDPAANPLVFEEYFKPKMFGKEPDAHLAQWLKSRLDRVLTNLNKSLAKEQYMAGQSLSLVDLFYIPYMFHLVTHVWPSCMDDRPYLASWWARMKALPAYQAIFE